MTSSSEVINDLYAGFPAEIRQELSGHEQTITAHSGSRLLQSGTSPEQLIILNSGSAETSVLAAGKSLSLGVAGPGKVFGLPSIIADVPTLTNVTCLEECEVTLVPKQAFLDVLQRYPQMYVAVVKVLSSDLAAANRVIRDYARRSTVKTHLKCIKPG